MESKPVVNVAIFMEVMLRTERKRTTATPYSVTMLDSCSCRNIETRSNLVPMRSTLQEPAVELAAPAHNQQEASELNQMYGSVCSVRIKQRYPR
mmetsp:Transcript_9747/g.22473  ORF Transcript_9747/g.22473 Transcript_9747/m.22473 type:complete len:94 (-) Transcript_9747:11-292(-)